MAVDVTFYYFQKKTNSTAQPTGGSVVSCNLRDGSDQFSPNLEVRGITVNAYNYMYIPLFGRYYYIDKCTWSAEQYFWIVSGTCDVLATFRDNIINSTQFVTRTSGDNADITIYDSKAVTTSKTFVRSEEALLPFTVTSSFGSSCVICNIAGEGLVCMTGTSYDSMMRNFLTVNDPVNVGQYWTQDIARNLTNPMQYILNAMCIPIAYLPAGSGSGFNPTFGWYQTPNTVYRVNQQYIEFSTSVDSFIHPDSRGADDYVNKPPFVSRSLYISGIGIIQLDDSKIDGAETLRVIFTIDFCTGGVTVRVRKQNQNVVVGYATGQLGYTLAVAQAHSPDIVSAMGGALMGSVFGGASGGIGGAIAGAGSSLIHSLGQGTAISVHGSTGGAGSWIDSSGASIRIQAEFKDVKQPYLTRQGRPLYEARSLSSLSSGSYVEVDKPSLNMGGNESEKIKVLQYLQGGVYLE